MTEKQALEKIRKLISDPQPDETYSLEYNGESNQWDVVTKINNENDDEQTNK